MTKKTHQTIIDWTKRSHPYILSVSLLFILISVIVIIVLTFLGYRYAVFEDARPDWEAYATIFSLVAAVGSIWVATYIPSQIAKKQNQIALFDKRFEVYQQFNEFMTHWSEHMDMILSEKIEQHRIYACVYAIENCSKFGSNIDVLTSAYFENDDYPTELNLFLIELQKKNVFMLLKIPVLFQNVQSIDVRSIIKSFQEFVFLMRTAVVKRKIPRGFVKSANSFSQELKNAKKSGLVLQLEGDINKIEI